MSWNPKQRIDDRIAFIVERSARDLQGQLGEISTRLESAAAAASDAAVRLSDVETAVAAGESAVRRLSAEIDVMQQRIARLVEDVADRMLNLERIVIQLQHDREQGRFADGSPT